VIVKVDTKGIADDLTPFKYISGIATDKEGNTITMSFSGISTLNFA